MGTPAYVGDSGVQAFSGTSAPTLTYTPTTAGNSIIVLVSTSASRTINSLADDMSTPTTYASTVEQAQTAKVFAWFGNNITDTDLTTWTCTFDSNATGNWLVIEVSGLSDTTPNDTSSSTTNTTANPALVAAAGLIDTTTDVFAVMVFRPTTTVTFTTPGSWNRVGTGSANFMAYRASATALTDEGSTNSTISLSGTRTGPGAIASFKADAAGISYRGLNINQAVQRASVF